MPLRNSLRGAALLAGALGLACCMPAHEPVRDRPTPPAPPLPTRSAPPQPLPTAAAASPSPEATPSCRPLSVKLPELLESDLDVPVPELEDLSGHEQMTPVYEKLAALLRGRAKDSLRIEMYGDSNMTRDWISGELRRTLQLAFGDGGHGFVAVSKPWNWYVHTDVRHGADKGWKTISMTTQQVADHLYGFAGLAAENTIGNAVAWYETAPADSPVGRNLSRVQVYYLAHKGPAAFHIRIDEKDAKRVETEGNPGEAGLGEVETRDGPHKVEVVTEDKVLRLLGVVLERTTPGVVVDSLGIGGVNTQLLIRGNRKITVQTLEMRHPDLVMLVTGATEPDVPQQEDALRELIGRHKEAAPNAPFMLMSPIDHATGTITHPKRVIRIAEVTKRKRRVGQELGTMWWDFHAAMGGDLSIPRFAERKMAWSDFIHLTERGGRYMGRRLGYALIKDFSRWLETHPDAGCD